MMITMSGISQSEMSELSNAVCCQNPTNKSRDKVAQRPIPYIVFSVTWRVDPYSICIFCAACLPLPASPSMNVIQPIDMYSAVPVRKHAFSSLHMYGLTIFMQCNDSKQTERVFLDLNCISESAEFRRSMITFRCRLVRL